MKPSPPEYLLTPSAMADVDRAASASGLCSYGLMQRAGQAVAACALRHFPGALRFVLLCGPGNNGGDGYIAAEALKDAGATVALFHAGDPERLSGDAARARHNCRPAGLDIHLYEPCAGDVVIDALFGAGLARDLPVDVQALIERVTAAGLPVIAVDLPSGVDGRTGQVRGAAFAASHTITFMARKPGHLLLPGRTLCGVVEVFDIGIPARIVHAHAGWIWVNDPSLWQAQVNHPSAQDHKYRRGHLTVFSGPCTATGAARMTATAGLKAGAGIVAVVSPSSALAANAAHLTAVMLSRLDTIADLQAYLADTRRMTFVLGPGFSDLDKARAFAQEIGLAGRRLVLDADGITAFKDDPGSLKSAFASGAPRLVVTPHAGEFARLFPDMAHGSDGGKVEQSLAAARSLNAVVVYKGADTVIAAPDGRAAIEERAPARLATAGSGDVLAGIIGAGLSQGMATFEAACAGVFLHGQSAIRAGSGMTAEELVAAIAWD